MHQKALARSGNRSAHISDCYTGQILGGGVSGYDYEHFRSSEAIFMEYRDRLANS